MRTLSKGNKSKVKTMDVKFVQYCGKTRRGRIRN
jgi:hypothetical protein